MASAKFCICPRGRLNIKMPFVMMGIPIIKVQWYNDCLIFIMEISIPGMTTFILGKALGVTCDILSLPLPRACTGHPPMK